MTRYRKIGKFGDSDVIKLKPNDKIDLGLEYNDEIDIDNAPIKKKRKEDGN